MAKIENITQEKIDKLINAGFKRWTVDNYDRLYLDSSYLGLDTWRTKSTGFLNARLHDYSGCKSREYIPCKNYVDLKTGKIVSQNNEYRSSTLEDELVEFIHNVLERSD